ncbi:ribose transport system permease protein [Motilibacter peucedani]|uniref:Ribose transport system permease protein n=1 Tax=Motilibacter peucedani TaxID=598650 RepID=A0A420XU71_9ACTN|nr:ABC transporter permease [Motilibacter peucedani]RKS80281.1 ribose transport system permease protein [Motilibacter peucedani]
MQSPGVGVEETGAGPAGASADAPTGLVLTRYEKYAEVAQRRGSLVVLVLTGIVASFAFDSFGSVDNLRNIALTSSFTAVVALGMTFVILTGGIDLSVGSVFALGGVLAAWGSEHSVLLALVLPLVVCGAIGLLNGVLITSFGMAPFIVTLTTLLAARGLDLALTTEGSVVHVVPSGSHFATMGQGSVLGLPWPVWIAIGLFALGTLLLQRTRFGQTVLAMGSNEDAARLMGLPVARTKMWVYVMSGLLAGFGGAMQAAQSSSGVPNIGVGFELTAISAVVIGGTLLTGGAGTTGGTLAGVLLLGVIANIINQLNLSNANWQPVVNGAFLVVVVVIQTYLTRRQRL